LTAHKHVDSVQQNLVVTDNFAQIGSLLGRSIAILSGFLVCAGNPLRVSECIFHVLDSQFFFVLQDFSLKRFIFLLSFLI
jgi:hypothetical protein